MKKTIITSAAMLLLTAPAYSLMASFNKVADETAKVLRADAYVINAKMEDAKLLWNSQGLVKELGFTDGDSDGNHGLPGAAGDNTEALTDVSVMGIPGNMIGKYVQHTNGQIVVGFTIIGDFGGTTIAGSNATSALHPADRGDLAGHQLVFTPFYLDDQGALVTMDLSSLSHSDYQILDYECKAYDPLATAYDMQTETRDVFKAATAISDQAATPAATDKIVSYAARIPAPFDKCALIE